jgi:hypothetical protein
MLAPVSEESEGEEVHQQLRELLSGHGAQFFADMALQTGVFPADLVTALWDMVWRGEVTNDTFAPLRSYLRGAEKNRSQNTRRSARSPIFRSRRIGPAR